MGWGEFAGKLMDIIDKFVPGRKEQYANELKNLEAEYAKALHDGRDTDASIALKRMRILRRKLGLAADDIK